ncbi:MAG TPA: conjugal transfer protein [Conexibacter sp.]|nr:conjugal transfer protein [Conexibacter sp.]
MLVRGVGDILADDPQPAAHPAPVRTSAAQFPDGEARTFAIAFARTYLTVDPRDDGRGARRLAPFVSQSLSDQVAPSVSPRSPGAEVAFATVAREVHLGESRALITVAVFLRNGRDRYLTVPVARDEAGGLVVYDLPALSAAPAAGAGDPPAVSELSGPDGAAVEDLAARFLRVYLHGGSRAELAYLLAPGVHVAPMGRGLVVEAIEEVARLGALHPTRLQVAVTARVRESATRARYRLRYRLAVARTDRWQVISVAGGPAS